MTRLCILIAAAGLLLGFAVAYRQRSRKVMSAAHSVAPEFSVTAIDGNKLSLANYRGKIVLLEFWATWCGPCREEIPRFVQLQDTYGVKGFQVIGISMDDSEEPVRHFYREFHMNYPVALGGAKLGQLYGGVFGLPITFLIDRDGRILSKHMGATDPVVFNDEVGNALATRTDAYQ